MQNDVNHENLFVFKQFKFESLLVHKALKKTCKIGNLGEIVNKSGQDPGLVKTGKVGKNNFLCVCFL